MTRRAVVAAVLLALAALLVGYTAGRAHTREAGGVPVFRPVTVPGAASTRQPSPSVPGPGPDSGSQVPLIRDPAPSRLPIVRAQPDLPAPVLTVREKPVRSVGTASGGVTGTASWYCGAGSACTKGYADGMYGAAGPALRVGDWRGRTVTVCASACVAVTLIDWCGCPGGRVIDLYRSAFARLASPSAGTVGVRVSW